ncbi:MAG: hypothetical protein RI911_802 [Candidatus Parcubacteria bacterium]|jgi:hypothetical protein
MIHRIVVTFISAGVILSGTITYAQTTATCKKRSEEYAKKGYVIEVKDVQRLFLKLLPPKGTALLSGKMDAATQAQLLQFQKQKNIPLTGELDAATKLAVMEAFCELEDQEVKKVLAGLPTEMRIEKRLDGYILLQKEMPPDFVLSSKLALRAEENPGFIAPKERMRIFKEYILPTAGAQAPYRVIYQSKNRRSSITIIAIQYTSAVHAAAAQKYAKEKQKERDALGARLVWSGNTAIVYTVDGKTDVREKYIPIILNALKKKLKI